MEHQPTDAPGSRREPEIIAPDGTRGERSREGSRIWVSIEEGGRRRIHVAQPGLFATILLLLLFGVIVAEMLALFLGAFLILIPTVIAIAFALIAVGLLRGYFNRLWPGRTTPGGPADPGVP
jgi:uncharacterized membrane protein